MALSVRSRILLTARKGGFGGKSPASGEDYDADFETGQKTQAGWACFSCVLRTAEMGNAVVESLLLW